MPSTDIDGIEKEVHDLFRRFDDKGQGLISKVQMLAILEKLCIPLHAAEKVIAEMDANCDNHISYDEFISWTFSARTAAGKEAMKEPLELRLTITGMDGTCLSEVVKSVRDTVSDVKEQLQDDLEIPWNEQRLMLGTQILDDELELGAVGCFNGMELTLVRERPKLEYWEWKSFMCSEYSGFHDQHPSKEDLEARLSELFSGRDLSACLPHVEEGEIDIESGAEEDFNYLNEPENKHPDRPALWHLATKFGMHWYGDDPLLSSVSKWLLSKGADHSYNDGQRDLAENALRWGNDAVLQELISAGAEVPSQPPEGYEEPDEGEVGDEFGEGEVGDEFGAEF